MKKLISLLLVFCLFGTMSISVSAINKGNAIVIGEYEKIYLEDGSYIIITTTQVDVNNGLSRSATTYSKTKTATNYDSDDQIVWQYVLSCTFSVNQGVSATCTSATYTYDIYNTSWSFSDGNSYASGNTGYGEGLFRRKVLFVTVSNVTIDLKLTCDIYGNIS